MRARSAEGTGSEWSRSGTGFAEPGRRQQADLSSPVATRSFSVAENTLAGRRRHRQPGRTPATDRDGDSLTYEP